MASLSIRTTRMKWHGTSWRRSWDNRCLKASSKRPSACETTKSSPSSPPGPSLERRRKIQALGDRKEALYREVIRRDGIEPLPGVVTLLQALAAEGLPCSVGSSTSRENILTIMEITGLAPYFAAITAERDVTRGKPDPQVFLKAAEKIGQPASDCVVFEDAHVGIAAALAAGAKAIAVGTTHPLESFTTAHAKVHTLEEITVAGLRALFV